MPSRPRTSRTPTRLLAFAAVLLSITWSIFAAAGGLSFTGTYPLRQGTTRLATPVTGTATATGTATGGNGPVNYGINHSDCLGISNGPGSDTRWQFAIAPPPISFSYLEVWVRTDSNVGCSEGADRGTTGLDPLCAKVATFRNSEVAVAKVFEIPDSAFMKAILSVPHQKADDAESNFSSERDDAQRNTICTISGGQDPINLYISFLLTDDTAGTLAGGGTVYELIYGTTYDLSGPLPPTIDVGAGNTLIKATWDTGTAVPPGNFIGYQAYCFQIGKVSDGGLVDTGSETSSADTLVSADTGSADTLFTADTGPADTGTADATPAETDPDAGVDTAVDDTNPELDSTLTADTNVDETLDDAAVDTTGPAFSDDPACLGASLPPGFLAGQIPNIALDSLKCGSFVGSTDTSMTILGLDNNNLYAVAIAGVDTYSNPGVLSNVRCETPRETVDFYDAFRDAGGTAGGGYCSYSPIGRIAGLGTFGLCAIGLAMRLARRRRGVSR